MANLIAPIKWFNKLQEWDSIHSKVTLRSTHLDQQKIFLEKRNEKKMQFFFAENRIKIEQENPKFEKK